ncbi:hypothetical protein E8E12_000834 [Didymella heteroderae]|uniref:Uncharacterized protein n=1 Tax=Didymella heteroderae TaxID=1769908 RepID=A0A9P4WTY3_9PLEO|nr:hypothetical protein E8E12_000834 [Didymella heteroderae]
MRKHEISQSWLKEERKSAGSGRTPNYPQCKLHKKNVITWIDGNPTGKSQRYNGEGRKAKAEAKAIGKPESDSDSEEDGEIEYDKDYESIGEPRGSQSPHAATPTEKEGDDIFYIDESQSSVPVLQYAGITQLSEEEFTPMENTRVGPQNAVPLAPCASSKRALEEADMPPDKRPSFQDTADSISAHREGWFPYVSHPEKFEGTLLPEFADVPVPFVPYNHELDILQQIQYVNPHDINMSVFEARTSTILDMSQPGTFGGTQFVEPVDILDPPSFYDEELDIIPHPELFDPRDIPLLGFDAGTR